MVEIQGVAGGQGTCRLRCEPVGRRKRLCLECGEHRPLFRVRGGPVRVDSQHTLCFRCRRSLRDHVWALGLRETTPALGLAPDPMRREAA